MNAQYYYALFLITGIGFVAMENKFIRPLFEYDSSRDIYNLTKAYLGVLIFAGILGVSM